MENPKSIPHFIFENTLFIGKDEKQMRELWQMHKENPFIDISPRMRDITQNNFSSFCWNMRVKGILVGKAQPVFLNQKYFVMFHRYGIYSVVEHKIGHGTIPHYGSNTCPNYIRTIINNHKKESSKH